MKEFVDEKHIAWEIGNRKNLNDAINKFSTDLKTKDHVILNREILTGYISEGGTPFLAEYFLKVATEDLAKLGSKIASRAIIDQVGVDAEKEAMTYFNHFDNLSKYFGLAGVSPDQVTIRSGRAILTNEEEVAITKSNTYTLNPDQEKVFHQLEQFIESIYKTAESLDRPIGMFLEKLVESMSQPGEYSISYGNGNQEPDLIDEPIVMMANENGELTPAPNIMYLSQLGEKAEELLPVKKKPAKKQKKLSEKEEADLKLRTVQLQKTINGEDLSKKESKK